jgi:hypothetical protein
MFFPYFLDATGASSKSRGQHWIPLCALFAILAASDLAFSQEKCVFAISELDFLVRHIPPPVSPPTGQHPGHFIFTNINLHNVCVYTAHFPAEIFKTRCCENLGIRPELNIFP